MAHFFSSVKKNIPCFPSVRTSISFVIESEIEILVPKTSCVTELDAFRFFQSKHSFNYDNESDDYFE